MDIEHGASSPAILAGACLDTVSPGRSSAPRSVYEESSGQAGASRTLTCTVAGMP